MVLGTSEGGGTFPGVWSQGSLNGWNGISNSMDLKIQIQCNLKGILLIIVLEPKEGQCLCCADNFFLELGGAPDPFGKEEQKSWFKSVWFKHCRVELGMRIKWKFPSIGIVQPGQGKSPGRPLSPFQCLKGLQEWQGERLGTRPWGDRMRRKDLKLNEVRDKNNSRPLIFLLLVCIYSDVWL